MIGLKSSKSVVWVCFFDVCAVALSITRNGLLSLNSGLRFACNIFKNFTNSAALVDLPCMKTPLNFKAVEMAPNTVTLQ